MQDLETIDFTKCDLVELVERAATLQESMRTQLSLVEEESQYFRQKYTEAAKSYV
jgi:hypothetical protein